ncbi:helix-hairpin-helix domain-containing protein [Halobacillus salinus]|uniref:helix-hairpin-helix domain-containing protein n=1 Tax=Halobacillus salinus TaxID=192814 RepID=UPI0009A6C40A|nr:helix-hairpin-helix domain-containing protein [Halobacillus salinus]
MHIVKRYGWIAGLVLVCVLIFSQSEGTAVSDAPNQKQESEAVEKVETVSENMKVDVKGEVINPGVYDVEEGMRVNDVVTIAGGMTENADPQSVNLAQVLQDEMVILVMKKNEENDQGAPQSEQIRLNQASLDEIQTLPGIGPSKAQAILDYREENGPFQSVEELLEVSGIGEKTLEGMVEEVRIP